MGYWAQFMYSGNPDRVDLPTWHPWSNASGGYQRIVSDSHISVSAEGRRSAAEEDEDDTMENRNHDKGGNEENESSHEAPRVDTPGPGLSPVSKVGCSIISMHPNFSLLPAMVLSETQRRARMMMESGKIV